MFIPIALHYLKPLTGNVEKARVVQDLPYLLQGPSNHAQLFH